MAAVLKTVERQRSGGSNPSASALKKACSSCCGLFSTPSRPPLTLREAWSLRSEQAASRSCLLISDNGKQIHGVKSQLLHKVNLESETHVHQRTGIRGSEHGAVILPRGTAVVECHTCVHADHVVLEEGVLIAQARVACQAGDMVLPGGGGVVFGLDLREQGRRLKAEAVSKQRPSAKYHPMPA